MPHLPLKQVDDLGQEGKLRLGSITCCAPEEGGEEEAALSCTDCLVLVLDGRESTNRPGQQRMIQRRRPPRRWLAPLCTEKQHTNELGMKMNTGAGIPGFPLQLCPKQQPWASLVSPCLNFPRKDGLFTCQDLGNRQVWQQDKRRRSEPGQLVRGLPAGQHSPSSVGDGCGHHGPQRHHPDGAPNAASLPGALPPGSP